jgi:hypothetical protein
METKVIEGAPADILRNQRLSEKEIDVELFLILSDICVLSLLIKLFITSLARSPVNEFF